MLKVLAIILVTIIIVLFGAAFFLGVFNPVAIEKINQGSYKIACLDNIGPYKNICGKIESVKKILDEQKISYTYPCAIFYDDPRTVSKDKLRSKGGYIITADKLEIAEKIDIPAREVVSAKVKANPMVAALKTYPQIEKWAIANDFTVTGPALEIYYPNGVTEVQMPISKAQK